MHRSVYVSYPGRAGRGEALWASAWLKRLTHSANVHSGVMQRMNLVHFSDCARKRTSECGHRFAQRPRSEPRQMTVMSVNSARNRTSGMLPRRERGFCLQSHAGHPNWEQKACAGRSGSRRCGAGRAHSNDFCIGLILWFFFSFLLLFLFFGSKSVAYLLQHRALAWGANSLECVSGKT
ncbi:hypothetical protein LY76DRAFT_15380 [Colletotrichum caudatum]|nr:hypothetical protein LY76DRAFT_15380 [Colletotrichum caudatum]